METLYGTKDSVLTAILCQKGKIHAANFQRAKQQVLSLIELTTK